MDLNIDKINAQTATTPFEIEITNGNPTAIKSPETAQIDNFAAALASTGEELAQTLQNAEAVSIEGINGKANSYEVASSVMEAEQSLRMAISVRDKIVAAYLEISRMQI